MRITLIFLLILATLIPISACSGNDVFKVDVFWSSFGDEVYLNNLNNMRNDMETAMVRLENAIYTMHDCEGNQDIQTEKIKTAITQGTDLLIVDIVCSSSWDVQDIVNLAEVKNLPIIFFHHDVSDIVVNSYDKCCFVGAKDNEFSYTQGQAIAEFLMKDDNLQKYDLDGDGNVSYMFYGSSLFSTERFFSERSISEANRLLAEKVKLVSSPANEISIPREGISKYGDYRDRLVDMLVLSATPAAELMRTALTVYSLTDGSIELILSPDDEMAIGAIEILNEVGYNDGKSGSGYIPIFGMSASDEGRETIAAGKMTGTVSQDSHAMARCIIGLAKNIYDKKDLLANTSGYNIDSGVNRIRIPCTIVG